MASRWQSNRRGDEARRLGMSGDAADQYTSPASLTSRWNWRTTIAVTVPMAGVGVWGHWTRLGNADGRVAVNGEQWLSRCDRRAKLHE